MIFDAFPLSFPLSLSHTLKNGYGKESRLSYLGKFGKVWETGKRNKSLKNKEIQNRAITGTRETHYY